MKPLSIESVFLPPTADIAPLQKSIKRSRGAADTLAALRDADFNTAYDYLRIYGAEMVTHGETDKAIETLTSIADTIAALPAPAEGHTLDLHAALMQILTAMHIELGDMDHAATAAAAALNLLAQQPKRKDTP